MRKGKSQRAPKSTTGRVFSSRHTTSELFYAATHSKRGNLNRPQLHRPAPPQWARSVLVQAINANSSSLNDMLTVGATIFQQIMTELNAAEPEEDRIMAITKILFKLMKHNDR
jgi:hypothetical protein